MTTSASYANVVQELYVAYFGRPADPAGLQNFQAALAAANAPTTLAGLSAAYGTNSAITALVNAFGDSGESGRLYGTAVSSNAGQAQQFVTSVFENLFNRAPLQAGLQFWSNALLTGSMTPGEAAMEIALGAATADAATFNNKIAAAATFTADLIAGNEAPGYSGPVAAADGRAFLAGITGSTTAATYQAGAVTAIDNMLGISPTPAPIPTPTISLTVSGDAIHLNGTTAASTVSLTGADLAAYPAVTFGTVAALLLHGTTSVTDSGGNFTLNASGNANATTFNFGTGVVSGADAASSAGITYSGVTTYVTSSHADTVTLSAANQNVIASAQGETINLGSLAYTGTLNLNAGTGGPDTINATVGGNLSGGTIAGTNGGAAIALVLSAAGTETLSTAEYNTITATTGGSITFTGGTFGTNHITFSNAGTVTTIANVGNYNIASGGDTLTLTNAADNVTDLGSAGGNTVNLGSLAYSGAMSFATVSTDTVDVTVGGDISAATITGSGAVALALSGAGTEKLNTAEYNLFNATGISGGTFGGNTIIFSNGGTVTANANVANYDLYSGGNTITLNNVNDNVSGAASGGINNVQLGSLAYTGTLSFGSGGHDTVEATVGGDLSGATITSTINAGVELSLNAAGTETLSTAEYNLFDGSGGGIFFGTGGPPQATIVLSNAGTVTSMFSVGNYDLSTAGNTITLLSTSANVTGAASGNDTVDLGALAYTGTLSFGAAGTDSVHATVGGDISGASISSTGAAVGLVLSGAGTETLNTAEYNLFDAGGISGGTFGGNTIVFSDAGTVMAAANVGNYQLSASGNTITLANAADNVTGAASGGNDVVDLGSLAYTGTMAFGAAGNDSIHVTVGGDISGATITSGGASVGLVFSAAGSETMTTAQYNLFNAGGISGGTFVGDGIIFSDAGSVTDNANVGNYTLWSGGNTITINNTSDTIHGAATGGDTYNLDANGFTGTFALGSSGADTFNVLAGINISGATINASGTATNLAISGSGTVTVSSAEAADFHAGTSAISAAGGTMNIADSTSTINLNAQENAVTMIGLQSGSNTVNISIGAASVNSGAAGFNQVIQENGAGGNTFNIDNGGAGATIVGASDASHYVTINNFNTTSDNINLTLSNNAQNNGEQNISDSGNDTITVGVNSVIVEEDLGALPGFTVFDATDLTSAKANILRAINASASTSGEYTFVIDSNQGAAIYEIHVNSGGGTIDGIQLIGVAHGVGAFNLVNHIA